MLIKFVNDEGKFHLMIFSTNSSPVRENTSSGYGKQKLKGLTSVFRFNHIPYPKYDLNELFVVHKRDGKILLGIKPSFSGTSLVFNSHYDPIDTYIKACGTILSCISS